MASVETIQGVGPVNAARLRSAGVRTCDALLERGSTRAGRQELADLVGLAGATVLDWVNRADLMRIRGIGPEYSDLLEASGVDTVLELAGRNAANLTEAMLLANAEQERRTGKFFVRRPPALSEVSRWIRQAADLPQAIFH